MPSTRATTTGSTGPQTRFRSLNFAVGACGASPRTLPEGNDGCRPDTEV